MNTSCHTYKWDVSWLMSVVLPHGSYVYVAHGWMRSWIVYVYRSWMDAFVTRYSAHRTETCHTYEFVTSHGFVMSHRWVCHVTQMSLSRHIDEFVTSHRWVCHVTWKSLSREKANIERSLVSILGTTPLDNVTRLIWSRHQCSPSFLIQSDLCIVYLEYFHTYEGASSHIWVAHGIGANESCRTYKWVMSHI